MASPPSWTCVPSAMRIRRSSRSTISRTASTASPMRRSPTRTSSPTPWMDRSPDPRGSCRAHPLCQGSGRSATVLAAYLMDTRGMTFDEVDDLLTMRRPLVKLQDRHREVLESLDRRDAGRRHPAATPKVRRSRRMIAPGRVPSGGRRLARPAGLLVTTAVLLATISAACGGQATRASPSPLTPSSAIADPGMGLDVPSHPDRASRLDRDRCRRRHADRGRGHRSLRLLG